jgi:hypothetical protein
MEYCLDDGRSIKNQRLIPATSRLRSSKTCGPFVAAQVVHSDSGIQTKRSLSGLDLALIGVKRSLDRWMKNREQENKSA